MIWSAINAIFGSRKPRRVRLNMMQQEALGERLESRVVMSATTLNSAALQSRLSFDIEPNNTRGTADFVRSFGTGTHSTTVYGNTGSGSDIHDWARFTLSGRTSGTIQLSGMTQDLDLELHNSSGTRIDRSIRSGKSTDTITLTNLAAGTYYVRVVPGVTGARSAYALRFGLTVSRPAPTTPTAPNLGIVGSGQFDVKRTDRLGVNGDTSNWYKFTVQSGKESTLRLRYTVTQGTIRNLSYRVEDASGKVILLKSNSSSTSTSRDLSLSGSTSRLAAGTYFIRFSSASNANLIYNFRVTATPNTRVNPDPNGPNNSLQQVTPIERSGDKTVPAVKSDLLTPTDKDDFFRVSGPAFKIVVTDGDPNDLRIAVFAIRRSGISPVVSGLTEQRMGKTIEVFEEKNDDFSAPFPGAIPFGYIIQVTSLKSTKTIRYRIES